MRNLFDLYDLLITSRRKLQADRSLEIIISVTTPNKPKVTRGGGYGQKDKSQIDDMGNSMRTGTQTPKK